MITVITGSNGAALRLEAEKEIRVLRKKDVEVLSLSDVSATVDTVSPYLGEGDLFGKRYAVILDRTFSGSGFKDFFFANLKQFAHSSNTFVVLEEKILADDSAAIEKCGGKLVVLKSAKAPFRTQGNIFALADALGERDKKKLWVLFEQAVRRGETPEAIAGTLFWQLKSMLLVVRGDGSSLSPFVASKAGRFVKNYSKEEIEHVAYALVREYHEARRSGLGLRERMEKLILSL